jgi:hypothetical protein
MTVTCKKCNRDFGTESELNTHVLLDHPKLARSDEGDYTAEDDVDDSDSNSNTVNVKQLEYR